MSELRITGASSWWWATGAPTGSCFSLPSKKFSILFLFFPKCVIFLLHREEIKSKAQRGGHTAAFLSVLTRLNSPFERLMRRNGLVEEPTECIHCCHHHLNPGLLSLQLWPPYMDGKWPVCTWLTPSLSTAKPVNHHPKNNTAQLNPVSMVTPVSLKPEAVLFIHVPVAEHVFLNEGGTQVLPDLVRTLLYSLSVKWRTLWHQHKSNQLIYLLISDLKYQLVLDVSFHSDLHNVELTKYLLLKIICVLS